MTKSPEDLEAERSAVQAPVADTSATEIDLAVGQDIIGKSPWEIFWRQFRRDRWALAGAVMVVIMILLAITAPLFAKVTGHGPNEVNLKALDQFGLQGAPFWWPCPPAQEVTFTGGTAESLGQSGCTAVPGYWLGVEGPGRDQFIRILYGARTSLFIAFFATGLAVILGVIFGLMAGFYRGKVDTVISRATDVVLSLPILLLALGLAAACGVHGRRVHGRTDPAGADPGGPDHRPVQLAVHLPDHPWPGALDEGEGVHRGFPIARLHRLQDHGSGDPSERRGTIDRVHDTHHPGQHPVRSRPVVPGRRRPRLRPRRGARCCRHRAPRSRTHPGS